MEAPLTTTDLKTYFLQGCKKPSEFQIGVEWEKIGVWRESGKAIPYSGDRGVAAIFQNLIQKYGWEPAGPNSPVVALKKKGSSITLEPGGQIELSGQKAHSIEANAQELYLHLEEIRAISELLNIAWLGIGTQPYSIAEEIEWMPKERYNIMREALKDKGSLTFSMMKETASVQVSLDYQSEEDALIKLKLGMGLSPFLTAMFANSPLKAGKNSGYLSRRAYIWEHTAPERSGIVWDVLDPKKGFQSYIDYTLDVPLLFLIKKNQWIGVRGLNFRQYMEKGYEGHHATAEDWQLHLSGIFTEARLKNYVEIRSIDCQKTPLGLAAVALIKGLFYHDPSRKKAYDLLSAFTEAELKTLRHEAAIHGLKAKLPDGRKILGICIELTVLAEKGLGDEKKYLEPLKVNLQKGVTPAELILNCFDARKPILSCTAIEG